MRCFAKTTCAVMGSRALRQSVCFYQFPWLFGRRPKDYKKTDTGTPPTDTENTSLSSLTATAAANGGGCGDRVEEKNKGVVNKATKEHNGTSAEVNIDVGSVSLEQVDKQDAAVTKKKSRVRCPRALQSPDECSMNLGVQESVKSKHSKKKKRVSFDPNDKEMLADCLSITKMLLTSSFFPHLFYALPRSHPSIKDYLNAVDKAVLPHSAPGSDVNDDSKVCNEIGTNRYRISKAFLSTSSSSSSSSAEDVSVTKRYIAERILLEESANHAVCIHMRRMDVVMPPRHLIPYFKEHELENTEAKELRQQQRNVPNMSEKLDVGIAPRPAPPEITLEIYKWYTNALKEARESQRKYKLPDYYHAVTHTRSFKGTFHGLNIVQKSGNGNNVSDAFEAAYKCANEAHDTDCDKTTTIDSSDESSDGDVVALMAKDSEILDIPFTLTPLLSVVYTCIPRREPVFGSCCDEKTFLETASSASFTATGTRTRKSKKPKKIDATTESKAKAVNSTAVEKMSERPIPSMPRFTTRLTLWVEHEDLNLIDASSVIKEEGGDDVKQTLGKKRILRAYCYITDGGKY